MREQKGTGSPDPVPSDVDTGRPSVARINDYALGGKDNYQIDRDVYEQILELNPEFPAQVRATRHFVVQSVWRMAQAGIDQFVALGTGLPTTPNVHEVARRLQPSARVVYVEPEPMVAAHARALLASRPGLAAVQHDVNDPVSILTDPVVGATLDPSKPIGVHFALMHYAPQPAARSVMAFHREKLAPGSMLALSALQVGVVGSDAGRDRADDPAGAAIRAIAAKLVYRTAAEIEELFVGLELLEPGIRDVAEWARLDLPLDVTVPDVMPVPEVLGRLGGIGRVPHQRQPVMGQPAVAKART
ncbi:MAG TPA: SAM-dependent methyltransferase [Pseudonocardia sp.]